MQIENWEKLEQIFDQASQMVDESERRRFVDEQSAGNVDLRENALRLLENDRREKCFLDEPIYTIGAQILAEAENEELLRRGDFAQYRLLEVIGQGGMGVVFLAIDTRLGRKVALKLLPQEFVENAQLRSYFEREARTAAAISHPNIAHIYETGEINAKPFIAMEYVEGKTLREHLRGEKKLSPAEALKIASQAASALAAAHKAGIIHRDIKPENIMLHRDGYIKVLDFGIAKLGGAGDEYFEKDESFTGNENLTGHGLVFGTIRYMSPEQVLGEKVDERSDIFSLGAVLYEMLTGGPAFSENSKNELIVAILEKEPDDLNRANFSPALLKILRRALAKSKTERYQTAAEMYDDLQNAPENLHKAQHNSPFVPFFLDKKYLLPTLFLLFAAITGITYFYYRNNFFSPDKSPVFSSPQLNFTHFTEEGRTLCAAVSPDAGRIAFVAEKDGLQSILLRDIAGGEVKEIIPPAPQNDFEGVCLAFAPDGNFIYYGVYENGSLAGKLYRVPVEGGASQFLLEKIDSPVSFSPDGQRMVFLLTDKNEEKIVVANSDGSQPQTIIGRSDPLFLSSECYPAWSPDGQTIAFADGTSAGQRQMYAALYHLATGKVQNLTTQPFYDVRQLAWLSDGSGLLFTARREGETTSQFYRAAYPSGETTRLFEDLFDYSGISLARNTNGFVTVAAEDVAQIWTLEIENPNSTKQISSGSHDGQGIAWLSNDSLVYGSNKSGRWDLWMIPAAGGSPRQLTNDAAFDTDPAAASDGSFVIFSSTRAGVYNLWRLNLADNSLTQITNGTGEYYPQISPDNAWAVFHRVGTGDRFAVWKVPTNGGAPVQLSTKQSSRADVSPDGKLVASTYREDAESELSIGIYSIDGAKNVTKLKPLAGARLFIPLRWSPDGKSIVYVVRKDGVDNLWSQSADGKSAPRRITNFISEHIYSFDFAPDGKRLAVARGNRKSHAVLIEGLQ